MIINRAMVEVNSVSITICRGWAIYPLAYVVQPFKNFLLALRVRNFRCICIFVDGLGLNIYSRSAEYLRYQYIDFYLQRILTLVVRSFTNLGLDFQTLMTSPTQIHVTNYGDARLIKFLVIFGWKAEADQLVRNELHIHA
jgi:hypothetical protein